MEKDEIEKLQSFLGYIALIFYGLSDLIILVINSVILHYAIKIKSILDIKSDEILNELLKKLLEDISINYSFSLIIVIVIPFLLIIFLVSTFVLSYKIEKEKEKENEDIDNIDALLDNLPKENTRRDKKDDDYDDKDED